MKKMLETENGKFIKDKGKEHLDKPFLDELKHKVWSTKGARFNADSRNRTISKYSNLGLSFLSAYLIVFGFLSVYNLYNLKVYNPNLIAFTITTLSIFLLIFSIFENSQNYLVKAKSFHDCALDLADIYNEIQTYKSYEVNATEKERMEFSTQLQIKYQNVLRKYENHERIDNKKFRLDYPDYYPNTKFNTIIVKLQYFFQTKFIYILLMVMPAIMLVMIISK
ncbi:hypothetical protein CLU83_1488 [Flavobacterium sp. 1]|uniref:SLATT domain-containing protein n=1 Tax=Flavobacterium sp. 1 TaxID=2035200 RepID=UPI000C23B77A|nr:SLATT domain-containing protein [Flavobacterium sp. 1]PJJ08237.1 hypothetical protein CLU83_1488 [Flavobacterium sp. 1]